MASRRNEIPTYKRLKNAFIENNVENTYAKKWYMLFIVINLLSFGLCSLFTTLSFLKLYAKAIMYYFSFAIWFITATLINPCWIKKRRTFIICFAIYIFTLYGDFVLSNSATFLDTFYRGGVFVFFYMFMGLFYTDNFKKRQIQYLIVMITMLLAISYIATAIGLKKWPNASRWLASENEINAFFMKRGIGGFGYIYAMPFLFVVCLFLISKKQKPIIILSALSMIALMVIVILRANYTTALAIALASIGLGVFLIGEKEPRLRILAFGFVTCLALVCLPFALQYAIKTAPKDQAMYVRLVQLYDALFNGKFLELERVKLMQQSFNAFLKNPLTGLIGLPKVYGGHSGIVDALGLYGLLAIPYYCIYLSAFYYQYKSLETRRGKNSMLIVFALFIMEAITNPLQVSTLIGYVAFCYVPLLIKCTEQGTRKGKYFSTKTNRSKVSALQTGKEKRL